MEAAAIASEAYEAAVVDSSPPPLAVDAAPIPPDPRKSGSQTGAETASVAVAGPVTDASGLVDDALSSVTIDDSSMVAGGWNFAPAATEEVAKFRDDIAAKCAAPVGSAEEVVVVVVVAGKKPFEALSLSQCSRSFGS